MENTGIPRAAARGICGEVRDFLEGLARELPGIFGAPRAAAPAVSRRAAPERRDAGELIKSRVAYWAARLGLGYSRVFIKEQRSRWGSCSSAGNLNFNWRLAAAPPEVLDYVVIHELCHLREMNHSRRFWALVAQACPDHKVRRRWLRDNGRALASAVPVRRDFEKAPVIY